MKKGDYVAIDSEYAMILSKLEIIFCFAIFCPLLYPITLIALNLCILFYRYTIEKLKWKIRFKWQLQIKSFPFYFLFFGVIIQQLLTVSFFYFSVEEIILPWILLGIYGICDLLFIFRCKCVFF